MDFEFKSKEELYKRVKPALEAKCNEFKRLGITYIRTVDIWNYLIKTKWTKAHNLVLFDIVHDILNADLKSLNEFIKNSKETIIVKDTTNLDII